jgi:hypothetical protein
VYEAFSTAVFQVKLFNTKELYVMGRKQIALRMKTAQLKHFSGFESAIIKSKEL